MRSWKLVLVLGLFAAGGAQAQSTGRITGTVTNEQGQPVASASVVVQGTRIGVVTAADGKYLIPGVPVGAHTVVATLIGYGDATRQVTVTAGEAAVANFQLLVKAVQLQGVVAVGYGTQQRRTVTGAVSTVRASQIREIATADPVKAIQGRVAGVEVVSSNNLPGASMNIRVRGVRSLTASNNPLYVVDGVPVSGDLQDFDPASIQSIDILKDAAATAIYGSRGANGVVLVTTKTGVATGALRTQFTADAYSGFSRPLQLVTMMNPTQYVAMLQAAARYSREFLGNPTQDTTVSGVLPYQAMKDAWAAKQFTDWQNFLVKTGRQNNFQLGLSGISGNTRFNLSGNYFDQSGLAKGQNYNRASGTLSVDHVKGRLRLGVTANGSRALQDQGYGDGLWGVALAQTGFGLPYDTITGAPVGHPDGEPNAVNPARAIAYYDNQFTRTRIFASAFGDLQLMDGLNLRVNFGPDYNSQEHGLFQGPQTTYPEAFDSRSGFGVYHDFSYTLDNMLQFSRDMGPAHHVDATLLYGIQKRHEVWDSAGAQQLLWTDQLWYNVGQGGTLTGAGSFLRDRALQYYMGRVVYTFKDRYTISGAIRQDGSSVLAPKHKWATFPTIGLGWQLGDEPFMKRFDWLTTLKLRGSYGVTGNSSINPYQTQGALTMTRYNWGSTDGFGYGIDDSNPANPDLGWEKTYQTDAAVEFGILNNRVTGSVDYYRQDTKDLLQRRTLPKTSGFSSALQNIGETMNRGLEVTLSTINLENWHGLRWTMDVNWAHNHNEIVKLATADTTGCPANARPCDLNNGWFVGQPINIGGTASGSNTPSSPQGGIGADGQRRVWYDYKMIGIWQIPDSAAARLMSGGTCTPAKCQFRPGEIRLMDVNGDGKINSADQVILGNTYPKWTASLYNRFAWKSFDLSALATFKWGYTIYDGFGTGTNQMQGRMGNIVTNYWTSTNASSTQPAPRLGGNVVPFSSTRGYLDGSHWRIRNVTLGYTLPEKYAGRLSATRARIYATAQDPFFFSSYKGYDPENGTSGGAPAYRTILLGANVSF